MTPGDATDAIEGRTGCGDGREKLIIKATTDAVDLNAEKTSRQKSDNP